MSEYDLQAEKFLKETETTFKAEFLKNGKHFDSDDAPRDIYLITLKRGEREFNFDFGQSLNCSGKYKGLITQTFTQEKDKIENLKKGQCFTEEEFKKVFWKHKESFGRLKGIIELNKDFKTPSAYDVLASLTSYDPDTFKEFCSSYGYDEDSRKAEAIYKKVVEEWNNIKMLWNDEEIKKLQEIN